MVADDVLNAFTYMTSLVEMLLDKGVIVYKKREEQIPQNIDISEVRTGPGTESDRHLRLKAFAKMLLKEEGETEVIYEWKFYDVYGATLEIVVECGKTPPYRLFDFLRFYPEGKFWQIPYSKTDQVKIYQFRRGEDRFFRKYRAYVKQRMKEMARRMR